MQTKLRMTGLLGLTFVAGLLCASTLAAAATPKAAKTEAALRQASENRTLKSLVKAKFGSRPQYVGMASWYGGQHQGRKMANGQPFDRRKMTAAAWNIPLGTAVRVVNLKNGKSVVVTITDRGPHPRLSRVIDLSEAAAIALDYVDEGLTRVFVTLLPAAKFESAEIAAELIEPPADLPVLLPAYDQERRAVAMAMAESLGLLSR
jgi:rare lipoprotein A